MGDPTWSEPVRRYGEVAAILGRVVGASGLSAKEIARRAGVRRSDLGAWLSGRALPATFEPLELIGVACGANEYVLNDLCDRWYLATHPPTEIVRDGIRFLTSDPRTPPRWPGEGGLYGFILERAWAELGRPLPVGTDLRRDPRTRRALDGLLLDEIAANRELRASFRRELLPWLAEDGMPYTDVRMLDHYAEASVRPGSAAGPVLDETVTLGLVQPDDDVAARAARLHHDGPGMARVSVLSRREREAATQRFDELAEEWITVWSDGGGWDRAAVEDGIRRCYELSGVRWHGHLVWTTSPLAGALADARLRNAMEGSHQWCRSPTGPGWRSPLWWSRPLWRSREPDELRHRLAEELRMLAGDELRRRAEERVERPLRELLSIDAQVTALFTAPDDPMLLRDPAMTAVRAELDVVLAAITEYVPTDFHGRMRETPPYTGHRRPWSIGERHHPEGRLAAPWLAAATLLERVCGERVPAGLRDRLAAYRDANAAGPWWPFDSVVIVAERSP